MRTLVSEYQREAGIHVLVELSNWAHPQYNPAARREEIEHG